MLFVDRRCSQQDSDPLQTAVDKWSVPTTVRAHSPLGTAMWCLVSLAYFLRVPQQPPATMKTLKNDIGSRAKLKYLFA